MSTTRPTTEQGFSLVELVLSMAITLVILGVAIVVFSQALSTRSREASKTDAITSAQAALNIMSREIGNSGYGLSDNGLVADSTATVLHFRSNVTNSNATTSDAGEDLVFYLDGSGVDQSVVRHDNNTGVTSGIINRISSVAFVYHVASGDAGIDPLTATAETWRTVNIVTITLVVSLPPVQGQPSGQTVTVTSDVTLRNSSTMRGQY